MSICFARNHWLISSSCALVAAGWLVPNHYPPWVSAWGDGVAIAGLLLLLCFLVFRDASGVMVSWLLSGVAMLSWAMLLAQYVAGKVFFLGDALMAALYVGLWFAAVMAGRFIAESDDNGDEVFSALASVWLFAALLSVGIALVQWTGALSLGIYAADLPPGARPFGNVAQPNNFCTVCFLGLSGAFWLHQTQRVRSSIFFFGAGFLLVGMIASQSRTGWLQVGLLVAWGLALRERAGLRIKRMQLLSLGTAFALGVMLWPGICDLLLLTAERSLDEQMQVGVRLPYWRSMLDAIGREPLFGYGWQQVGVAQLRVALDHPPMGALFQQSHNFVLDLFLWNGLPVGGLIIIGFVWWFVVHIRSCRDARRWWLLSAVGGVFTHGLLEYPLEYAYFLIPVGIAMGGVDCGAGAQKYLQVPRMMAIFLFFLLSVTFSMMAVEYLNAEENYRSFRMESARIGVDRIVTPTPNLRLLTQLEAFFQFGRTEAKVGMGKDQTDWMRKVSERFGYPSVMFRYALAAGLNGEPDLARETIARLCRIHVRERCAEALEGWSVLQLKYPELEQMEGVASLWSRASK